MEEDCSSRYLQSGVGKSPSEKQQISQRICCHKQKTSNSCHAGNKERVSVKFTFLYMISSLAVSSFRAYSHHALGSTVGRFTGRKRNRWRCRCITLNESRTDIIYPSRIRRRELMRNWELFNEKIRTDMQKSTIFRIYILIVFHS